MPKALGWAMFSSALSVLVNVFYYSPETAETTIASTWFSYSFLLSFLVVFRTQSAYSRYWEGATVLASIKADFVNAASCMFAFCSTDPNKKTEVRQFQHLVVRLMSLLHCSGLQQVASMEDEAFVVFEMHGLNAESIQHLNDNKDEKALIVLQWIQKLVLKNMGTGVLPIPAPIASRVFQQLGQGVVKLAAAKKISDIPFPFPYTQMVTLLLVGSTMITPVITGLMISNPRWAGALTFGGIFGFWAINYIAAEIEMPFGDDQNDLPISDMQLDFNRSLAVLLKPLSLAPPSFTATAEELECVDLPTQKCSIGLEPRHERCQSKLSGAIHSVEHGFFHAVHVAHDGLEKVKGTLSHSKSGHALAPSPTAPAPDHHLEEHLQSLQNGDHADDMPMTMPNWRREVERQRHKDVIELGEKIEVKLEKVAAEINTLTSSSERLAKGIERWNQRAGLAL